MKQGGPLLQKLTHRLSECPPEFLMEPKCGDGGIIHVGAVVSDLMVSMGGTALEKTEARLFWTPDAKRRNYRRVVLICSWIFHDSWFRDAKRFSKQALSFLKSDLDDLSKLVNADLFVTDPDRREELVRLCLNALDLIPQDEKESQALDRLETLNSVKRSKIIKDTRAKQDLVEKLRKAMQEQKTKEAAARYSPE